ncbi:MAG: hypothetical protein GY775_16755 [Candidatus Scalindua sp.]|nr:hypothetical protein [Candidatus Scalindua sp.]
MIDLKNRETKETNSFVQKRLDVGVQLVKINQVTLEKVPWNDNDKQVKFWLEGKEIGDSFEGFKTYGEVVAKGLVAEATFTNGNFNNSENANGYLNASDTLINNLLYISEKTDMLEAFQNLEVATIEELVVAFSNLVKNKYIWVVIGGREYVGSKGVGMNTFLVGTNIKTGEGTKYRQVYCKHADFAKEVVTDAEGNQKLEGTNVVGPNKGKKAYLDFQKGNTWYFKPLEKADADPDETTGDATDDLPF